jgi:hypothetical protein
LSSRGRKRFSERLETGERPWKKRLPGRDRKLKNRPGDKLKKKLGKRPKRKRQEENENKKPEKKQMKRLKKMNRKG